MKPLYGQLVRTVTRDGVRLEGFWQEPDGPARGTVIFVHGLSGNFYVDFTDALAERLLAAGYAFLRTNNRGHDMGNLTISRDDGRWQIRKLGSPWDHFPDAVLDIAAWVDFAAEQGSRGIVLLGHSLGTVKVTYYLGETGDPRVRGLVLASPADLIGLKRARHCPERSTDCLETARQLVAAGRGDDFMPPACSIGLLSHPLCARAYLDNFGETPAWDLFDFFDRGSTHAWRHLSRVRVPVYAYFGSVAEVVPPNRIAPALALIRQQAIQCPSVTTRVFDGADHWYTGVEEAAAGAVVRWLSDDPGL